MPVAYFLLSLMRVAGLIALFIGSWLLAYFLGHAAIRMGLVSCTDDKSCEMFAGLVAMPLGGVVIYLVVLIAWSVLARR